MDNKMFDGLDTFHSHCQWSLYSWLALGLVVIELSSLPFHYVDSNVASLNCFNLGGFESTEFLMFIFCEKFLIWRSRNRCTHHYWDAYDCQCWKFRFKPTTPVQCLPRTIATWSHIPAPSSHHALTYPHEWIERIWRWHAHIWIHILQ